MKDPTGMIVPNAGIPVDEILEDAITAETMEETQVEIDIAQEKRKAKKIQRIIHSLKRKRRKKLRVNHIKTIAKELN